jgi:hypothetical protein
MSYSFTVAADTKAEAKAMLTAKFDDVVDGQPMHAADRDAVQAAAEAFVDILTEPAAGQQIVVNVHGAVSALADGEFIGASAGVGAAIATKG